MTASDPKPVEGEERPAPEPVEAEELQFSRGAAVSVCARCGHFEGIHRSRPPHGPSDYVDCLALDGGCDCVGFVPPIPPPTEEAAGLDEAQVNQRYVGNATRLIETARGKADREFHRAESLQAQLDEAESRLERAEAALAEAAAKQRWNLRSFEAQLARAVAAEARERQMAEALREIAWHVEGNPAIRSLALGALGGSGAK